MKNDLKQDDLNKKDNDYIKDKSNQKSYKKFYIKHEKSYKSALLLITILIIVNAIFFISPLNQEIPNIELSDKIPNQANAVTDNQTVQNQFEYKECPLCNSSGTVLCKNCKGTGQIEVKENKIFNKTEYSNSSIYYVTCDVCKGKGELICKNCNGEGQIKTKN